MQQPPIFRLGIVMAGAVSAGAYTAGVMDYLFETLEIWEQKKRTNRRILAECGDDWELAKQNPEFDASVPMHQVVLEALAGASAGGMTAGITALSMFEGFHFYDEKSPDKNQKNRLYQSWVDLNDEAGKPTFEQMLDNADIVEDGTVSSILNSKPIDIIADRLDNIKVNRQLEDLGYVSPNLNLILTLCSLRGIPIDISFNTRTVESNKELPTKGIEVPKSEIPAAAPAHRMFLHKGVGQFSFYKGEPKQGEEHVLSIDPTVPAHRKMLIEVAKATGAFPVGLKHRVLEMPDGKYVQAQVKRLFGMERQDRFKVSVDPEKPFRFVAVDGGAINNEPIGEVDNILEDLYDQDCANGIADAFHKNFGIIMIDPFPDFETATEEVEQQDSLTTIPGKLFGALRRQAMLKEGDIRRGFRGVDYTRGLIFPSKKNKNGVGNRKFAIACASLDGFGGFLSREFREHDFLLGRRNCQSFLRKFFTVPETSPVLGEWTEEMRERCSVGYEGDERRFYPIIPDLRGWGIENDPTTLQAPPDVSISVQAVCKFYPALKQRTLKVIRNYFNPPAMLYRKKAGKPKVEKDAEIRQMINRHTGGLLNDLGRWGMVLLTILLLLPLVPVLLFLVVIPLLYLLLTNLMAGYVARQKLLKTILTDLKEKDLLKA